MLQSWLTGLRRVLAAPAVAAGVYLVTLGVAVPPSLVLRQSLERHLGASLMAESAADGLDWDWWQEFSGQASGLEESFTPAVLGAAAPLANLSGWLDRTPQPLALAAIAGAYGAVWLFLWGGILDRYARGRATRTHGFFAACGVFFFRFLRLGVVAAVFYWLLLGPVHGWLFGRLLDRLTRDVTVERVAFAWRIGCYLALGAAIVAVNLVVDYAKIRAVVEDRRAWSAPCWAGSLSPATPSGPAACCSTGWLWPCWRSTRRESAAVRLSGTPQWPVRARPAAGRLSFAASQTCCFQTRLAHAGYAAFPTPPWPESPDAESVAHAAAD
jgi:hypothetical protein